MTDAPKLVAAGVKVIDLAADFRMKDAKQFEAVAQNVDPGKMVAVLVRRGDNTQFVPLRPRAQTQK